MERAANFVHERWRLNALAATGIVDSLPDTHFDSIARFAAHMGRCSMALVTFVTAERVWHKAAYGMAPSQSPRAQSFCTHTIENAKTLWVADALLDARFRELPAVVSEPSFRLYAGAPIMLDAFALGAVCVMDREPRAFDEVIATCLEELARLASEELCRAAARNNAKPTA
jgi:GAF domain-containing protein